MKRRARRNHSPAFKAKVALATLIGDKPSMGRKGDCWDNAPSERFFRSLKYEQLNYEKFRTKESAKLSIIDYLAFIMVSAYTQN
jgi:transposase InsO family protein